VIKISFQPSSDSQLSSKEINKDDDDLMQRQEKN
jgi:hypothetical protein